MCEWLHIDDCASAQNGALLFEAVLRDLPRMFHRQKEERTQIFQHYSYFIADIFLSILAPIIIIIIIIIIISSSSSSSSSSSVLGISFVSAFICIFGFLYFSD